MAEGEAHDGKSENQAHAAPAGERREPPDERRGALLLLHGIGQQSPYETVDAFVRGLIRHGYRRPPARKPEAVLLPLGKTPRAGVRLYELGRFDSFDVIEFYWGGMVQGRITARQVFGWLLRTGLAPLNFVQQLPILRDGGAGGRLRVVMREVLQAMLLLTLVVVLLAAGLWTVVTLPAMVRGASTLAARWSEVFDLRLALAVLLLLVLLTTLLSLLVNTVESWWTVVRLRRLHRDVPAGKTAGGAAAADADAPWGGMNARRLRELRPALLAAIALLALLVGLLGWRLREPLLVAGEMLLATAGPDGVAKLLLLLLFVALIAYGRWLLVHYLGDIVLYVTSDQTSAHYRTRHQIRSSALALLEQMLAARLPDGAPRYHEIYLAGHSLGSVIAYDCLNALSRRLRLAAASGPSRGWAGGEQVRGLLTFGSPLEKVHYFFRERVTEEQAVRAQLLSFLHPTRKRPSGRDYGPYQLARYQVPFADLDWVNVYSPADPISDRLVQYDLSDEAQRAMPYRNPFIAHTRYWRDPDFYRWVVRWLGCEPER